MREAHDVWRMARFKRVISCNDELLACPRVPLEQGPFALAQNTNVWEDESLAVKFIEGSRRDDLEFAMGLHQQNQNSAIGAKEIFRIKVSCLS